MEVDDMQVESAYLQAIQSIPGTVPGAKYKELNLIARKIAAECHGNSAAVTNIPEPLLPLVDLEIAKLSRQHESVVKALKSDDSVIINRVMTMRWFFRGDNKKIMNVDYFEENIFPFVSLNTRIQLIIKLAHNLKASRENETAEQFYTHVSTHYDRKQSEPLLVACGKPFLWNIIKDSRLILSCKSLENLYYTYPDVAISYLKSSEPTKDPSARKLRQLTLEDYRFFLPRLIKNHVKDFIELLEMHNSTFKVQLSNKATEAFLKKNMEVFLNNPKLYIRMMQPKFVAAKLTKVQFKRMLWKLLPKRLEEFNFSSFVNYLEYFPKEERATLVIDAYRVAYKANLLENKGARFVDLLSILPAAERVKQARIKLKDEPDWRKSSSEVEEVWRCYLPTAESIPSIKAEISETSPEIDVRQNLALQLIYTCKVNEDKDALLEVLSYYTTRHKNEPSHSIFTVLDKLVNWFDLTTVSEAHWAVLNKFIRLLHVKGEILRHLSSSMNILCAGIHYNLINNLPIDLKIGSLVEINFAGLKRWNILNNYPEYERCCLDAFLTMIPKKYPKEHGIWEENVRFEVVESIVEAIYNFNARNAKAKSKVEVLSLKNYPWLLDAVKSIVQFTSKDQSTQVEKLKYILRKNEKDVYKECASIEERDIVDVETGEALALLAKDPQNILDHCEYYVKKARMLITYHPFARRFIRQTRWYQEIPLKIVDSCLKYIDTNKDGSASMAIVVLGLLMEGAELARVIEPLTPNYSAIDTEDDQAKSSYEIMQFIPIAMNFVNPPVSPNLVLSFCQNDYLDLGLITLTNTCRRVSVDKIQTFTKTLVDRQVSVKKHGIRMFCLVASIRDYQALLIRLWMTEKNTSIRDVIFRKIYRLFVNDPTLETWQVMRHCIAGLKENDIAALNKITDLTPIPNHLMADYIKELLETFEKSEPNDFSEEFRAKHVSRVLYCIKDSIAYLMPEDFSEQLLRKYFCNPGLHPDVSFAGSSYVIKGYLQSAGDKLEQRLNTLCNVYETVLKEQWDVPHPEDSAFFPVNNLAHRFMASLININYRAEDQSIRTTIMEAILKSFLNVLKPQCDFESYALLTLAIPLKDANTTHEMVHITAEILPRLVQDFGDIFASYLPDIAKKLINLFVDWQDVDSVMYDLVDRLSLNDNRDSCLLAARFLHAIQSTQFPEMHMRIVEHLWRSDYPEVVGLIYIHVNNRSSKQKHKTDDEEDEEEEEET